MGDYAQGGYIEGGFLPSPAPLRLDELLMPGESILDSTGRIVFTRPAPPETDDD